jgi:hypothetical protein
MSDLVVRRNADGSRALVLRDERGLSDHELFRPIIEDLERVIEILGGRADPMLVFDDAMELLGHASQMLREVEPTIEGAARDEARKMLSKAIKQLRETQSIYQRGGDSAPGTNARPGIF